MPDSEDLEPLFATILSAVPAQAYTQGAPLQAHVTNLDASPVPRPARAVPRAGGHDPQGPAGRVVPPRRLGAAGEGDRDAAHRGAGAGAGDKAGPGDIIAVAGIPEITIGETLADPDDPAPAAADHRRRAGDLDDDRHEHLAARPGEAKGAKVTARLVKDRLDRELVGNVSLRVLPTERPDTWEVQGRGELALAILVEQMRREGFELTVGKPQVVTRELDGKVHEPVERLTIDAPEEYLGAITQLLAVRKGRMEQMSNHGTGWVRMEFLVPSRGLIGFRTEFLTDTRGTGIAHHVFDGYEPWFGDLRTRSSGSMVADRSGAATSYAMTNLQERGTLFVDPTTEVYEGMVVGENSRSDDMDVNITKEKKLTNVRSNADELERLVPARRLSLEQSLEFCREDECVEVTAGRRADPQGRARRHDAREVAGPCPPPRGRLRRPVACSDGAPSTRPGGCCSCTPTRTTSRSPPARRSPGTPPPPAPGSPS